MPPVPSDPLQECLKVLVISAAGATQFMEYHQLVTIEDMLLFLPSEYQYLMKIYIRQKTRQANKFGMTAQKKVAAFIYWVSDLQRRQEPIIYIFWTQSQLVLRVQELEMEVSCAKDDPVETKVGKIDVGWVWDDWKESFFTNMGSTTGVDGVHRR